MFIRLLYLFMVRVFGWLVLLAGKSCPITDGDRMSLVPYREPAPDADSARGPLTTASPESPR